MNSSKTEFIMFGGRQQLNKCSTTSVRIAGDTVNTVRRIRYLGAYLDETLQMKDHIKAKCRSAMMNFFRIKSISKYLTKEATETLVLSLVISHLDYCNSILYNIAEKDIYKFQRIQNMCAKLVLKRSKYDSSKQALHDLHWLPIKCRINQKILSFMYQCSVGSAPAYLTELLCRHIPKRQGLRSADQTGHDYVVPFSRRKTFADRSFSVAGPSL